MPVSPLSLRPVSQEDSPSRALRAALAERLAAHRASVREVALRLGHALPASAEPAARPLAALRLAASR